jgi:hypothetical protein
VVRFRSAVTDETAGETRPDATACGLLKQPDKHKSSSSAAGNCMPRDRLAAIAVTHSYYLEVSILETATLMPPRSQVALLPQEKADTATFDTVNPRASSVAEFPATQP